MEKLTVLYNDQCPVCSLEIDHYRALCEKRTLPLAFEKISRHGEVLQASGLSADEAKKRLHVRLPSGEIRVGVDAFLALWAEMPGYRILGRVIAFPGMYHSACLIYDRVLAPLLYWWDQRRMRSDKHQRARND
jgi:predicted DCC family thiol-disulfide oxidoreductase YuxK